MALQGGMTGDQQGGGQQGGGQGGGGDPQTGTNEKLRQAKAVYQQLKDKKPKSKDEYSKLQKAVQVIAKSDDETAKSMITYRQKQQGQI